ncbi:MAG: hypothetical protein HY319_03865 [Armatimonadetes bacterium]|nr:hypothetical protein [Armatimonadota bacterium]
MRRTLGLVFLACLVVFLASWLGGCSGDEEVSMVPLRAPAAPVASGGAAVQGFVMQVNPVFLVSDPAQAPAGASPRQNALVTAYDPKGNLVGLSLTNDQGQFRLASLPSGFIRIEARLDPAAPVPDAVAEVTALPGTSIGPNPQTGTSALPRARSHAKPTVIRLL